MMENDKQSETTKAHIQEIYDAGKNVAPFPWLRQQWLSRTLCATLNEWDLMVASERKKKWRAE